MHRKHPVRLTDSIIGVITISLEVPEWARQAASTHGYELWEIDNIIGQEFQRILDTLTLDDETL